MALTQVSTGGVKDGTLLNADVNAAASIAGTKVSPNFGSQNIVTTGGLTVDTSTLHVDTSNNRVGIGTTSPDGTLDVRGTIFVNGDGTGGRLFASSGNLSLSDGNGRQVLRIDDPGAGNSHAHIFDSNGRLGVGTTSVDRRFHVEGTDNVMGKFQNNQGLCLIEFEDTDTTAGNRPSIGADANQLIFFTGGSTKGGIDVLGRLGIGTTDQGTFNQNADDIVISGSGNAGITIDTPNSNVGRIAFGDPEDNNVGQITYSHSSNLMSFDVNAASRIGIASDGKVGIGTISPARLLQQHLASSSSNYHSFTNSTTGSSSTDGFLIGLTSLEEGLIWNYENTPLRIGTNNTERMRIDSSGNVGIGTTSPATKLHINGGTYAAPTGGNDGFTQFVISNQAAGQGAGIGLLGAGNMVTFIHFGDSDDANVGAIVYNNVVDSMQFHVNASERMNIDSSGNLNINNDSGKIRVGTHADLEIFHDGGDSAIEIPSGKVGNLNLNMLNGSAGTFIRTNSSSMRNLTLKKNDSGADNVDYFQCRNSANSLKLQIQGTGDVRNTNNSYGQISDIKLKENVVDANSQWNDIKAIRVRNWNYKESTGLPTHTQIGVVAQELETVSPGLVDEQIDRDNDTGKDLGTTTKGVKYSVLYIKAVKCLQEAMARIEVLETEVAALKAA